MTIDEVKNLQGEIQEKVAEKTRLEGRREQLMTSLKDDFGCSSLESAKAKLSELNEQSEILEGTIADQIKAIEDTYELS